MKVKMMVSTTRSLNGERVSIILLDEVNNTSMFNVADILERDHSNDYHLKTLYKRVKRMLQLRYGFSGSGFKPKEIEIFYDPKNGELCPRLLDLSDKLKRYWVDSTISRISTDGGRLKRFSMPQ